MNEPLKTQVKTAAKTAGVATGVGAVVALAIPLVMAWEGLRQDPYFDQAQVRTVCWGETSNVQERRYSVDECRALLAKSMDKHAKPVLACIPDAIPIEAKAAFVSMGYNIGPTAFCATRVAALARAGNYAAACAAVSSTYILIRTPTQKAWDACPQPRRRIGSNKVRYCVSPGLLNRRRAESTLCLNALTPPEYLGSAELWSRKP